MPFHFVHLTDPHIPPPGETLPGGHDPAPALERAVADIIARHGPGTDAPAGFVVLTGDLVRDGEPAAYARLRETLAPLPCPVHFLLGNHDDRPAFLAAFPAAPVDATGFVQHAFDTPAGRALLLDTLSPGEAGGHLCAQRLHWLATELAHSESPLLLFLHHPPFAVGIAGMDAIRLADAEALWAVLAPHASRVKHIFHGHLHRPTAGNWRGIPISAPRGTAFAVPLEFGVARVEPRFDAIPTYAVVRADAHGLIVHTREVPAA